LGGIARQRAAWMPHVDGGAGKPLLATPFKSEERRIQAAAGIKTICRDSDTTPGP